MYVGRTYIFLLIAIAIFALSASGASAAMPPKSKRQKYVVRREEAKQQVGQRRQVDAADKAEQRDDIRKRAKVGDTEVCSLHATPPHLFGSTTYNTLRQCTGFDLNT
jgi:hypothetical protein